jgi:hypothetical protein
MLLPLYFGAPRVQEVQPATTQHNTTHNDDSNARLSPLPPSLLLVEKSCRHVLSS